MRNRGNNEWSKRSNCSVHQSTKVSSAEEHNQYILIPQRVSQQVNALSPSRVILSALRKLGILQQISNIPQQSTQTFLTSIPDSLDLRLFPGGIPDIQRSHFPNTSQKFPQESPIKISPGKFESISPAVSLSPVDSGSLSLAEHERVVRLYLKSYFLNRI